MEGPFGKNFQFHSLDLYRCVKFEESNDRSQLIFGTVSTLQARDAVPLTVSTGILIRIAMWLNRRCDKYGFHIGNHRVTEFWVYLTGIFSYFTRCSVKYSIYLLINVTILTHCANNHFGSSDLCNVIFGVPLDKTDRSIQTNLMEWCWIILQGWLLNYSHRLLHYAIHT